MEEASTTDIQPQCSCREANVLDLPEEIIRHIFSFMTDAEVYFNVRCVCRQLRRYVEEYIQLGKKRPSQYLE